MLLVGSLSSWVAIGSFARHTTSCQLQIAVHCLNYHSPSDGVRDEYTYFGAGLKRGDNTLGTHFKRLPVLPNTL